MRSFALTAFTISVFLLSIGLTSCSSVSKMVGGRHKYDHAQNFEGMQRYNFGPMTAQLQDNQNMRFIRDAGVILAIENTMAAKQIRKERYGEPDFWLNFFFTGEQELTAGQLNQLFGYNLGLAWDDKYGSGKGIANSDYRFSRRTLIIDLISRDDNRLIWRGSTPTNITADRSDSDKREALNSAVEVILAPFPPENIFKSLKRAVPE